MGRMESWVSCLPCQWCHGGTSPHHCEDPLFRRAPLGSFQLREIFVEAAQRARFSDSMETPYVHL